MCLFVVPSRKQIQRTLERDLPESAVHASVYIVAAFMMCVLNNESMISIPHRHRWFFPFTLFSHDYTIFLVF